MNIIVRDPPFKRVTGHRWVCKYLYMYVLQVWGIQSRKAFDEGFQGDNYSLWGSYSSEGSNGEEKKSGI